MINYRGVKLPGTILFGETVTSDNLFCENEQVVFDFYARSGARYATAIDIGANIGAHSVLMARQGWVTFAYEPDHIHFKLLEEVLALNGVKVHTINAAVSNYNGEAEFTRVLGNTTGSHLTGLKTPYGPTVTTRVRVVQATPLFERFDFIKIDAEGAEADIIGCMRRNGADVMTEIGTATAAEKVFSHVKHIGRKLWVRNDGKWVEARELYQMPIHHSYGPVFIGDREP